MSFEIDYSKYNFSVQVDYKYIAQKGLNEKLIKEISSIKNEPAWVEEMRLKALEEFYRLPMPKWGPDLSGLDLGNVIYYAKPTNLKARSWDDLPPSIRETFERLGVPEAEKKFLAGVGAQFESEVVYHNMQNELEKQGVIFTDMEAALE